MTQNILLKLKTVLVYSTNLLLSQINEMLISVLFKLIKAVFLSGQKFGFYSVVTREGGLGKISKPHC